MGSLFKYLNFFWKKERKNIRVGFRYPGKPPSLKVSFKDGIIRV
jgi:hypothetical protein